MNNNKYTFLILSLMLLTLDSFLLTKATLEDEKQSPATAFWLPEDEPIIVEKNLADILARVGPNMRASADYHDFQDIDMEVSIKGWKLLHNQVKILAKHQVNSFKPKIQKFLIDANVSVACQSAVDVTLNSMENLESWSVQMWSATGSFPPVGFLDGQYTDLGSYQGCLNILNETAIGYTNYCTLAMRPIVPSRPQNHMIFKKLPESFRKMFNRNEALYKFQEFAQYYYYFYLRTGICVPNKCTPNDIQKVSLLIGRRLALMSGPIKCFTRSPPTKESLDKAEPVFEFGRIENDPILVETSKPISKMQLLALLPVAAFFGLVALATMWHVYEIFNLKLDNIKKQSKSSVAQLDESHVEVVKQSTNNRKIETMMEVNIFWNELLVEEGSLKSVAIDYFSVLTHLKEFLDVSMRDIEIKCLHGLRVFTMAWIICVHSLQYNQWDGFTRIHENESVLRNIVLHPIYNASYVVDNFFFMSGLLAAYTTWCSNQSKGSSNFSVVASLVGRYLRLTPQVFLISLLYILLPLVVDGPFSYDMTYYAAKTCEKNWWINLLHLQAFYREDEICNLVSWWISVDMFYYIIALALVYLILNDRHKIALISTASLAVTFIIINAYKHFINGYTPNNLGTVPQVGEVWTGFVVNLFWSPYAHVVPFYLGFWMGYVIANNKWKRQVLEWSRIGWFLAVLSLATVSFSSHIWMSGSVELGNQYISTTYNATCSLVWAISFAWIVIACHYGYAETLNKFLSLNIFVLISKASFIIYLSHMLWLRIYFGSQNSCIEVSVKNLSYVVIGHTVVSIIFGVFLCVTFEGPCMKMQKVVVQKIKKYLTKGSSETKQKKKSSMKQSPTKRILLK